MNTALIEQIDNIIDRINNNETISSYKSIKKQISNDNYAKKLLANYNKELLLQNNNKLLIALKKELYNHPLISKYLLLETELHYFVLTFNYKLTSFINVKQCKNPTI